MDDLEKKESYFDAINFYKNEIMHEASIISDYVENHIAERFDDDCGTKEENDAIFIKIGNLISLLIGHVNDLDCGDDAEDGYW